MKYIKKYESKSKSTIYNLTDIVVFKEKFATSRNTKYTGWDWQYRIKIGVIIEWQVNDWIIKNGDSTYWVRPELILRLANDKEIETFKMEQNVKKYNL